MNIKTRQTHASLLKKAEEICALLKTLAHPQRLCIICHIIDQPRTVNEIVELCGLTQPQVSQFLTRMKEEGLISCKRQGRSMHYHVSDPRIPMLKETFFNIMCAPQPKERKKA